MCVSVCPSPFFSFSLLEVSSSPEEFQWCFKPVKRVFELSRMLQGSLRVFTKILKGVSRKFKRCLRKFQECFKEVSDVIPDLLPL